MVTNLNLGTWAEINLDSICRNIDKLKGLIPAGVKLLAVIKADAYGHGAKAIAECIKDKSDFFGAARIDEGVEIRECGIENKILILGHSSPHQYETLIEHGLIPTIYDFNEALLLNAVSEKLGKISEIHIAVNTGMNRIGFDLSDESLDKVCRINSLENIKIGGIFSHFADADNGVNKNYTYLQLQRFRKFTKKLSERGVDIPIRHIFNSAATTELECEFDMVREGIYIYGLSPSDTVDKTKPEGFEPAMSLRSEVIFVHDIEKGDPVGYGLNFTADKKMKIATVCCGYADGFPRLLSGTGCVIINGHRANIIGNICMDQLMCDVTDIPGVQIGSVATLIGRDGETFISADEVAECAHTINYEIICGISKRVPRVYLKGGTIDFVSYGIAHGNVN